MKRNWDLVREILIKLEEKEDCTSWLWDNEIKGYDNQAVAYHYKLLTNAGLINGKDISSLGKMSYVAISLTWQGHEFLDKIRNESIWNKVKYTVQNKSLDLSFDVIKEVATAIIKTMLS